MKTKVVLKSKTNCEKQDNKNNKDDKNDEDFKKLFMKSVLLSLLEDKKINQTQYEECKKRLDIF